jgi:beta-lactamase regulating signal transducer with metallopeptidase domain
VISISMIESAHLVIAAHPAILTGVLTGIGTLLSFLLQSTLCFLAVGALTRLTRTPSRRFAAWMTYLAGTLGYAVFLVIRLARTAEPGAREMGAGGHTAATELAGAAARAAAIPAVQPHLWTLPASFGAFAVPAVEIGALAYAGVVLGFFLAHGRRQSLLRRALSFACEPKRELLTLAEGLAASLGVKRVCLRVLPGLSSPATIGWLRPLILLPPVCEGQSVAESADILHHELHHIRRRDWLLDHVARAIRALLFFQPMVWIACRQLRLERELACDQAVIGGLPEMRARYAESLVRFARLSSRNETNDAYGMDFAAAPGDLHSRVHAILTLPENGTRGLRFAEAAGRLLLLGALALGLPYGTIRLVCRAAAEATATGMPVTQVLEGSRTEVHPRRNASRAALRQSGASDDGLPADMPAAAPQAAPLMMASAMPAALATAPDAMARPVHIRFQTDPAAETEDRPQSAAGTLPANSSGATASVPARVLLPPVRVGGASTAQNPGLPRTPRSRPGGIGMIAGAVNPMGHQGAGRRFRP